MKDILFIVKPFEKRATTQNSFTLATDPGNYICNVQLISSLGITKLYTGLTGTTAVQFCTQLASAINNDGFYNATASNNVVTVYAPINTGDTYNGVQVSYSINNSGTFQITADVAATTFSGGEYGPSTLDVTDVEVDLEFAVDDISSPEKKATTKSRTITIPGTDNNDKFFGYYYESNVSGSFNPKKRTDCEIRVESIPVIKGSLQLKNVNYSLDNKVSEYECQVTSYVRNLFDDISGKYLNELNITGSHTASIANITQSWSVTGSTPSSSYVYPLIDYGQHWAGAPYEQRGYDLYPAVFVRNIIDTIFSEAGYQYSSSFLDQQHVKQMVVPYTNPSGSLVNARLSGSVSIAYPITTAARTVMNFDNINYNVWNSTSIKAQNVVGGTGWVPVSTYVLDANLDGTYTVHVDFDYTTAGGSVRVELMQCQDPLMMGSVEEYWDLTATGVYNLDHTVTMVANSYLYFVVYALDAFGGTINSATMTYSYGNFEDTNNTVYINQCLPINVKQDEFIQGLIDTFNLYFEPDANNDRLIIIEPYTTYYNGGSILDWTQKLDESTIYLRPTTDDLKSKYVFQYKEGDDFYNKQYQDTHDYNLGAYIKDIDNDFTNDIEEATNKLFSATYQHIRFDATADAFKPLIVTPRISEKDIDECPHVTSWSPRLLYWNGIQPSGIDWWLGTENSKFQYYANHEWPYAGHLLNPHNTGSLTQHDLNYDIVPEEWLSENTTNTVYNEYWKQYIDDLSNGKILTAKFKLEPTDIYNLRFRDIVFVTDAYYQLLKVTYSPINDELSEVELLKINDVNLPTKKIIWNGGLIPRPNIQNPRTFMSFAGPSSHTGILGGSGIGTVTDSIIGGENYLVVGINNSATDLYNSGVVGSYNSVHNVEDSFIAGTNLKVFTGSASGSTEVLKNVYAFGTGSLIPEITSSNQVWLSGDIHITGSFIVNGSSSFGMPAGSDKDVQFNDGGVFGGEPYFTYDKALRSVSIGSASISTGADALAQGYNCEAEGNGSYAGGLNTYASGHRGHAEGSSTIAGGDNSHAEGGGAQAAGNNSHAEGSLTQAIGQGAHAEGESTIALGDYSHAEGWLNQANGLASSATGYKTTASGDYSHAEGAISSATGEGAHVESVGNDATGDWSHAEGNSTLASGESSHAENAITIASGDNSHAEGDSTIASGLTSHAEGFETVASGSWSHAQGYQTQANGDNSCASGLLSIASGAASSANNYSFANGPYAFSCNVGNYANGDASFAAGNTSIASGHYSAVFGLLNEAFGQNSMAWGVGCRASGSGATAAGTGATASGDYSFSLGNGNVAAGYGSVCLGVGSQTTSTGIRALSFGDHNICSGQDAIAIGTYNTSSEPTSVCIGDLNIATGSTTRGGICIGYNNISLTGGRCIGEDNISAGYSFSIGYKTTSSNGGHAEGYGTAALGDLSHAEGARTWAAGIYSHAEGSGSYIEFPSFVNYNSNHAQGILNYIGTASTACHAGGTRCSASGNYGFIHSDHSKVSHANSAVLGGQFLTSSQANEVLVPMLHIPGSGSGIIMHSPDNTAWFAYITDAGTWSIAAL